MLEALRKVILSTSNKMLQSLNDEQICLLGKATLHFQKNDPEMIAFKRLAVKELSSDGRKDSLRV